MKDQLVGDHLCFETTPLPPRLLRCSWKLGWPSAVTEVQIQELTNRIPPVKLTSVKSEADRQNWSQILSLKFYCDQSRSFLRVGKSICCGVASHLVPFFLIMITHTHLKEWRRALDRERKRVPEDRFNVLKSYLHRGPPAYPGNAKDLNLESF